MKLRDDGACPGIALQPLMIISRQPLLLRNALESFAALENAATIELIHQKALDFLPRRLGGRMSIPAGLQESRSPLVELSIGDQQLGAPLAQVDTYSVPGLYECESPVGGCFG